MPRIQQLNIFFLKDLSKDPEAITPGSVNKEGLSETSTSLPFFYYTCSSKWKSDIVQIFYIYLEYSSTNHSVFQLSILSFFLKS